MLWQLAFIAATSWVAGNGKDLDNIYSKWKKHTW